MILIPRGKRCFYYMSKDDKYDKLEGALAGGAIGAALGALLTEKQEETIVLSLLGAACGATYQAFKESRNMESGILYEENGAIYKALPNGRKELVKKLDKNNTEVPKVFTID